MANWRNRSMTFELKGFDELYQQIEKAGKNAEVEGKKCFYDCANAIHSELHAKAQQAGLAQRLLEKMNSKTIEGHGVWRYEVGWKKQKSSKTNPLPDTYKVMF